MRNSVIIGFLLAFLLSASAHAADLGLTTEQAQFLNDISIAISDVKNPEDIVVGKTVRLYATVHNHSKQDQKGVVRFYNEKLKKFMGPDQPFSAIAGGDDTVFLDVEFDQVGKDPVAIRVVPDNPKGDNPANDKVTTTLVADIDTDQDGVSNRNDPDADSDGVSNAQDSFPLDAHESQDTDRDGVGNNADTDDDNDGVPDVADPLPQNHAPVPVINMTVSFNSASGSSSRTSISPSSQEPTSLPTPSGSSNTSGSTSQPSVPSQNTPNQTVGKPPSLSAKTGELITFNGGGSYDPDGHIQTIEWDFGDGTKTKGSAASHAFSHSGTYNVITKVTDNAGEVTQKKIAVQIQSTTASRVGWLLILAFLLLVGMGLRKGLPRLKKSSKIRKLF